ncbi:MAG: bacteriophage abortive infection AbiH family protein [Ruminococcus sp.]|nr:bacteriophage abortive infection AbiH family protein [Ruminococcus sp.]
MPAQIHLCECKQCHQEFIFREADRKPYLRNPEYLPWYCPSCTKEHRDKKRIEEEAAGTAAYRIEKEKELPIFESALEAYHAVSVDEIQTEPGHTLTVIGNGFDLMHGVKSGYYDFRDSLGKNSPLRTTLEHYILADDIWADFENNLAKINYGAMIDPYLMDMWLENFDAYEEDTVAPFYIAIDAAITPITTICTELPKRFRQWVGSLKPRTDEKPLKSLISNGPTLCFNYTEFVESIYSVSSENVCYIHGKRDSGEKLVLGHLPTEDLFSDVETDITGKFGDKMPLISIAQDQAGYMLMDYDDELTKPCGRIIKEHQSFFDRLYNIDNVAVVGHSLYPVDWDYFRAVVKASSNPSEIHWYFGCHGLPDLKRIEAFISEFHIKKDNVTIFRTDTVKVRLKEEIPAPLKMPQPKKLCQTADGRWSIKRIGGYFVIEDNASGSKALRHAYRQPVSRAFFNQSGEYLFAVIGGVHAGVIMYRFDNGQWKPINELIPAEYQNLINPRLKKVFLNGDSLTFVYNNRIREYDTRTGDLIQSKRVTKAPFNTYDGEDLTEDFLRRR